MRQTDGRVALTPKGEKATIRIMARSRQADTTTEALPIAGRIAMPAVQQKKRSPAKVNAKVNAKTNAERARVQTLFERLQAANPHPVTELVYRNPFELLVSVVLSAQATDKSVNLATPALFRAAPTPEAMFALGEAGIREHIRSIGLFRTKAANLLRTCAMLVTQHGGQVPRTRDQLEALPGVGRKTANVLLNTLDGEPCIAVDTHILRVSNRLGLSMADTPQKVEQDLMARIPSTFLRHAHHWLVLHGRYVCKARSPSCATCLLADLCPSRAP